MSRGEEEVLLLLSDGKTTSEIARRMRITISTVHAYCARLKRKLGARNFTQLIRTAVLLCGGNVDSGFPEFLNRVNAIEIRFFDLRGRLITKRKYRGNSIPSVTRRSNS